VEVDPLGSVTREPGCGRGLRPRPHDFIGEPDGSYWLLCDEARSMDLTNVGGVANASVTGTVVQHLSATGDVLFDWSPFDHFAITDGNPDDRRGASVNWTHGNAIDFDSDGNLIVSFRNLDEVTKIDVRTGDVLWRLGGRRNEFTFVDAPTPSFAGQHSARAYAPGALMLLDNIGDPAQSRAEWYTLDERARTVRDAFVSDLHARHEARLERLRATIRAVEQAKDVDGARRRLAEVEQFEAALDAIRA